MKRQCLATGNISYPSNLSFAPIDFETTTQREGLANAGFDFNVLTFFALLGVTQYLTNDAIEMIFQFVESTPAGSELVFEFIVPDELMPPKEAAVFAAAARLSAERGEPWLARLQPGELRAMLDALGFAQVTHFTPEAANKRYFSDREDALAAWSAAQMMRAIV